MATIFLGLGSNLGDREGNIREAVRLMADVGIEVLRLSSIIETYPVGGPPQGLFLNAVAKAHTVLSPQELLTACQSIEGVLGRARLVKNGPRTIDIDILLYDDLMLDEPRLVIPHPRMQERDFVMVPLREVSQEAG